VPPLELESAGDPALAVEAPPDAPGVVVEAAAIAVDQASRGVGLERVADALLNTVVRDDGLS